MATSLGPDLLEYEDRGHFLGMEFPELLEVVNRQIDRMLSKEEHP